jgi:hypothetical protein
MFVLKKKWGRGVQERRKVRNTKGIRREKLRGIESVLRRDPEQEILSPGLEGKQRGGCAYFLQTS